MRITPETAREVRKALDLFGAPASAAHQIRVSLAAVRPYRDRGTDATLAVLDRMAALTAAKQAAWHTALAAIAAGRSPKGAGA